MNLTYFHLKKKSKYRKQNNSLVKIRFVAKTSNIRNFSENIRSDVKTRAAEPSSKWHSSSSGALHFINMTPAPAPELLIFMSVARSSSGALFLWLQLWLLFVFTHILLSASSYRENEFYHVHKTKRIYCTKLFWVIQYDSFSQAAVLPWGTQRKNNHRFRRFREQLLAET